MSHCLYLALWVMSSNVLKIVTFFGKTQRLCTMFYGSSKREKAKVTQSNSLRLQAGILEWVAGPFSRGPSQPRSPAWQADSLPLSPLGSPPGKKTGTTEDEMVGWHHQFGGREFEQALGTGDGQGSLACCSPRAQKESDMTEQLDWTYKREILMKYIANSTS